MVGLKNRIVELACQLDAANAEMEEVKRFKETTELELKGYEFQLAFNDVSIQTLEVCLIYFALLQFELFFFFFLN